MFDFLKKEAYIRVKHIINANVDYDFIPYTLTINIRRGRKTHSLSEISIDRDNIRKILAQLVLCRKNKAKVLELHAGIYFIEIPRWAYDSLIEQISNYFDMFMITSMAKEILGIKDEKKNEEGFQKVR